MNFGELIFEVFLNGKRWIYLLAPVPEGFEDFFTFRKKRLLGEPKKHETHKLLRLQNCFICKRGTENCIFCQSF